MLRRLGISWAILTVAIALTAWILPSVEIIGGILWTIWVAALFGLINAVLGTILRILTLPLTIITLGLFAIIVNAAMVGLTSHVSSHFDVHGFWAAVWAALLISLFSVILNWVFRTRSER